MPSITETLIWEHRGFRAVFDKINAALPELKLPQLKHVARQLETMLLRHAAAEDDLVLLALNQAPTHKRRFERFHQQHLEINGNLTQVHAAEDITHARQFLKEVLGYSHRHFKYEEEVIFPMLVASIDLLTLDKLGALWLLQHRERNGGKPGNPIQVNFNFDIAGRVVPPAKGASPSPPPPG